MKKNKIMQWVKGIVAAYIISGVVLLVLAFLMYRFDVAEGIIRGGILSAYVVSCFVAGCMVSRPWTERKYLWGLLAGAAYFLILWIVSMIGNRQIFSGFPSIVPTMLLCVFGGMLGGMMQAGRRQG